MLARPLPARNRRIILKKLDQASQRLMGSNESRIKVKCPTCKKSGEWFAGSYGPFCSKRCKLIDLGKWLGEEFRLSEPLRPDQIEAEAGSEHEGTKP